MHRLAVLAALVLISACSARDADPCLGAGAHAAPAEPCAIYKSPKDAAFVPHECRPTPPAHCAPQEHAPPAQPLAVPNGFQPWAEMPNDPLNFVIGDEIRVTLPFYEDEDSTTTVAPDGNIYIGLIGGVRAAGRSPLALERDLERRYSEFLRFPEVGVVPSAFESRLVYVGGQVDNPGAYPLTGPTGALEAVFQAGGFLSTAYTRQVVLIRRGPNDLPMLRILNLRDFANDGTPTENTLLRPFDIIFVPRSPIAKLNLFVQQYISQVVPFNQNFSYVLFDASQ